MDGMDYIRFGGQLINQWRANHERSIATIRSRDISPYLDLSIPFKVLDLANGRLRPQFELLRSEGHKVIGIDLANLPSGDWSETAYRLARWIYQSQISKTKGPVSKPALVCGNVNDLPFRSNYFDLVTSVAAFEHFLDVPAVVSELYRVLRPGGVAHIYIHLFTSLSGGHNIKLMEIPLRTIPKGVKAWDHLREQRLPFHVPLNKWRIHQYHDEFSHYFEILKAYCAVREGEHLLTTEIEKELSAYSRDELTCGAYVILAQKSTANDHEK